MMEAAVEAVAILVPIGAIRPYWAKGGSAGKAAAIPSIDGKPIISPSAIGTAAVGSALFAMAALVAATAGWLTTPLSSQTLLFCGLLALVFVARALGDFRYVGLFKRLRRGAFARRDSYFYSPLSISIATLIGLVAIM